MQPLPYLPDSQRETWQEVPKTAQVGLAGKAFAGVCTTAEFQASTLCGLLKKDFPAESKGPDRFHS